MVANIFLKFFLGPPDENWCRDPCSVTVGYYTTSSRSCHGPMMRLKSPNTPLRELSADAPAITATTLY